MLRPISDISPKLFCTEAKAVAALLSLIFTSAEFESSLLSMDFSHSTTVVSVFEVCLRLMK